MRDVDQKIQAERERRAMYLRFGNAGAVSMQDRIIARLEAERDEERRDWVRGLKITRTHAHFYNEEFQDNNEINTADSGFDVIDCEPRRCANCSALLRQNQWRLCPGCRAEEGV